MNMPRLICIFLLTELLYCAMFFFFKYFIIASAYPHPSKKKSDMLRQKYGQISLVSYLNCWKLCKSTPKNKRLVWLYCCLSLFMAICFVLEFGILIIAICSENIQKWGIILADFWELTFLGALGLYTIMLFVLDVEWRNRYPWFLRDGRNKKSDKAKSAQAKGATQANKETDVE